MLSTMWRSVGMYKPSASISTCFVRLFSCCHVQQTLPKNSVARRKKLDEYNKRRRFRYKNDPIYHKMQDGWTARYLRKRRANDEEFRDRENQALRKKYIEDAVWRANRLAATRERAIYKRKTYAEYRARKEARDAIYHRHEHANNPLYVLRRNMRGWILKHQWVREDLPWKSHDPIIYPHRVEHHCETCGYVRRNGFMLWWRRKFGSQLYDCHACYIKRPGGCMPEGYEDASTYKQLVARKRELDKLNSAGDSRANTAADKK